MNKNEMCFIVHKKILSIVVIIQAFKIILLVSVPTNILFEGKYFYSIKICLPQKTFTSDVRKAL